MDIDIVKSARDFVTYCNYYVLAIILANSMHKRDKFGKWRYRKVKSNNGLAQHWQQAQWELVSRKLSFQEINVNRSHIIGKFSSDHKLINNLRLCISFSNFVHLSHIDLAS
jgi:hypothetical protein